MRQKTSIWCASTLATIVSASIQLPYNPTRIIPASNGTIAYIFSPVTSSSQFSLSLLDTNDKLNSTSTTHTLFSDLPFLSDSTSEAFVPLIDDEGITVLAGDCQSSAQGVQLWRYTSINDKEVGEWSALQVVLNDATLGAEFLSAGFTFSPTASINDTSLYVFGGMCPNSNSSTSSWTSDATYSNTMLTLAVDSPTTGDAPYQLSITGSRAPPIAEAGLTITSLPPTFSNTSTGSMVQQQNFVLLGGHTQNAFINMSQVAMFSLPQESWAFISVEQPGADGNTELVRREITEVEPRSGHTAVLTEDGSKIIVLGGWVGDTSTPAQPQLAVLEIGQGYGGDGAWAWSVPAQSSNAFGNGRGMYGHGAALLPGGVMMISGGYAVGSSSSKSKRAANDYLFFNTTSMQWVDSYINPNSPNSPAYVADTSGKSSGLKTSEKAGLGAGIGLGLIAILAITIFWLLYSRKLRQRRAARERELREMALGAGRYHSDTSIDEVETKTNMRSASWGNMQERQIGSSETNWPLVTHLDQGPYRIPSEMKDDNYKQAERSGLAIDAPSPTRGLRKSLYTRGPASFGPSFPPTTGIAPGVFRIDEEEEGSQTGSLRRAKTPHQPLDRSSVHSDPFKDPPVLQPTDQAAEERKREVEVWVEDWASAAESMHLSRNPSQVTYDRTYSNLSQAHSHAVSNSGSGSGSGSVPSGRGSPEKSDRTGSNLSERSIYSQPSMQQSGSGNLSRNVSQRSASTGYALFSGAAAAMSRLAGGKGDNGHLMRQPSGRSVSLTMNSNGEPIRARERAGTASSARSNIVGDNQTLLLDTSVPLKKTNDDYWTPPESPIKERYARAGSLTKSGAKALGLLGSVKRVLTGTGSVDVQNRVATIENKSGQSSPTKHSEQPEMVEVLPRRTVSANQAFWRGKKGARDWDQTENGDMPVQSPSLSRPSATGTVRRKPVPGSAEAAAREREMEESIEDDWDVETAVQQRVVQVMFTIPKEKLRVVNADALSLLSSNRSEVDHEEEKDREREVKRMSSVRETDEVDMAGREKNRNVVENEKDTYGESQLRKGIVEV